MRTITLQDFCESFGVHRERVQQLTRHGVVSFQGGNPGRGRPARVTHEEAFTLAVLIRLLDLGVPREIAGRAARSAHLFDLEPAFLVVSTGALAPAVARFHARDEAAKPTKDAEQNVGAMEQPLTAPGAPRALFAWITIPYSELAGRLADPRRTASAVVALDGIEAAVLALFDAKSMPGD